MHSENKVRGGGAAATLAPPQGRHDFSSFPSESFRALPRPGRGQRGFVVRAERGAAWRRLSRCSRGRGGASAGRGGRSAGRQTTSISARCTGTQCRVLLTALEGDRCATRACNKGGSTMSPLTKAYLLSFHMADAPLWGGLNVEPALLHAPPRQCAEMRSFHRSALSLRGVGIFGNLNV